MPGVALCDFVAGGTHRVCARVVAYLVCVCVTGVPGSSHNGVAGIGGVFGVGGFLGPSYPIEDKVAPMGSFASGPACTCTSCTGSPPVCTGCTCR